MRAIIAYLMFLGVILLSSRIVKISTTKSAESHSASTGEKKLCSLHNVKMHRTIVKIHYGKTCSDINSKQLYPNAKKIICGGCVVRLAKFGVIFYCKKCNEIKKEILKPQEES